MQKALFSIILMVKDSTLRKSKTSVKEIEEAERAEDHRRSSRKDGFSMADIRDRGWQRLSNGIVMCWHVDRELDEGEVRTHVPKDSFVLVIDGENHLFDTDEFRKFSRWA